MTCITSGALLDHVAIVVEGSAARLTIEMPLADAERVLVNMALAVAEARAWRADAVPSWAKGKSHDRI